MPAKKPITPIDPNLAQLEEFPPVWLLVLNHSMVVYTDDLFKFFEEGPKGALYATPLSLPTKHHDPLVTHMLNGGEFIDCAGKSWRMLEYTSGRQLIQYVYDFEKEADGKPYNLTPTSWTNRLKLNRYSAWIPTFIIPEPKPVLDEIANDLISSVIEQQDPVPNPLDGLQYLVQLDPPDPTQPVLLFPSLYVGDEWAAAHDMVKGVWPLLSNDEVSDMLLAAAEVKNKKDVKNKPEYMTTGTSVGLHAGLASLALGGKGMGKSSILDALKYANTQTLSKGALSYGDMKKSLGVQPPINIDLKKQMFGLGSGPTLGIQDEVHLGMPTAAQVKQILESNFSKDNPIVPLIKPNKKGGLDLQAAMATATQKVSSLSDAMSYADAMAYPPAQAECIIDNLTLEAALDIHCPISEAHTVTIVSQYHPPSGGYKHHIKASNATVNHLLYLTAKDWTQIGTMLLEKLAPTKEKIIADHQYNKQHVQKPKWATPEWYKKDLDEKDLIAFSDGLKKLIPKHEGYFKINGIVLGSSKKLIDLTGQGVSTEALSEIYLPEFTGLPKGVFEGGTIELVKNVHMHTSTVDVQLPKLVSYANSTGTALLQLYKQVAYVVGGASEPVDAVPLMGGLYVCGEAVGWAAQFANFFDFDNSEYVSGNILKVHAYQLSSFLGIATMLCDNASANVAYNPKKQTLEINIDLPKANKNYWDNDFLATNVINQITTHLSQGSSKIGHEVGTIEPAPMQGVSLTPKVKTVVYDVPLMEDYLLKAKAMWMAKECGFDKKEAEDWGKDMSEGLPKAHSAILEIVFTNPDVFPDITAGDMNGYIAQKTGKPLNTNPLYQPQGK